MQSVMRKTLVKYNKVIQSLAKKQETYLVIWYIKYERGRGSKSVTN